MSDRDYMAVSKDEAPEKPERPVYTPQAGSEFMSEFLAGNTDAATRSTPAEGDAESAPDGGHGRGGRADPGQVERDVIETLRTIFDPEIPVNIYELGLIYAVEVDGDCNVDVIMTLTTPHCPVAESLPLEVEQKVRATPGVNSANLDLVWDPPWDLSKMSDEARLELGLL